MGRHGLHTSPHKTAQAIEPNGLFGAPQQQQTHQESDDVKQGPDRTKHSRLGTEPAHPLQGGGRDSAQGRIAHDAPQLKQQQGRGAATRPLLLRRAADARVAEANRARDAAFAETHARDTFEARFTPEQFIPEKGTAKDGERIFKELRDSFNLMGESKYAREYECDFSASFEGVLSSKKRPPL